MVRTPGNKRERYMTINEIMQDNEGNFTVMEVYELKDGKVSYHTDHIQELYDDEYSLYDEAVDYEIMDKDDYDSNLTVNSSVSFDDVHEDGSRVLVILVRPARELTYIHVGSPSPNYAINSLSRIFSVVSYKASSLGYELKEERNRDFTGDIILAPNYGEGEAEEVLKEAADYMTIEEDYTGVEVNGDTLRYDAAFATIEKTELTRNY